MDTTAAAELGFGELDGSGAGAGGGLGFWHSGPPGSDQWRNNGDGALLDEDAEDEDLAWDQSTLPAPPDASPASPSGGFARRQTPGSEPPAKMLRAMPDGNATAHSHGGGLGFSAGAGRGHGSGNFAGSPSPSGAGAGTGAVGRGRGMGSIFYKTKLCSRFRSGNCPYNSSCNFAHGMEELRKPPPGWEEFVASQELPPPPPASSTGGGGGGGGSVSGPGGAAGPTDSQVRFHKTRPCKKYFGEGNCPYGEKCNFLHDEQSVPRAVREAREAAVAGNSGGGGGGVDSLVAPSSTNEFPKEIGPGGGSTSAGSAPPIARPSSWKTRLCNKWETTGHCPCGDNCHFAHGSDELQRFGGGLPDPNTPALSDSKSGGTSSMAVSLQQKLQGGASSSARSGSKGNSCWRGPNEISTIYGDWWVEDDFWQSGGSSASHESAELETDLWKETQRRTHIPTPPSSTPRAVPFFRRTTSLELSRQTPDSH